MSNKEFKLSEIAKKLDLSFEGDPNYKVNSIKILKEAGKLDISFYYSKKFKKDLEETNAGIVLLEKNDDTNSIKIYDSSTRNSQHLPGILKIDKPFG